MDVDDLCPVAGAFCRWDTPLSKVAALLLEGAGGSLPVLDPHRRVLGSLSEADVLEAFARFRESAASIPAAEIMDRDIVTGHARDGLRDVLRLLTLLQERRLHIVDDQDRWCGSLSIEDLLGQLVAGTACGEISGAELIEAFCRITQKTSSSLQRISRLRRTIPLRKGA